MKFNIYFKAFLRRGLKGVIHELGETLKDRFATPNERMRAIEILSLLPEKVAVPQLLKRFDLVSENALRDTREKELISRMLVGEGKTVLASVVGYARSAQNVSWPIAIIGQLTSRREYVSILLGILSATYPAFDKDIVNRNREIIVGLQGIYDERIPAMVEPHLSCRYPEIQEAVRQVLEQFDPANAPTFDATFERA